MRPLHDPGKEVPGPHCLCDLAVSRVHQIEVRILIYSLHELIGYGDRDVEVVDCSVVTLALYELLYVRVPAGQYAHVGPAPRSALLDLVRRGVEDAHKGHRARGDSHRGADPIPGGPQPREAEARPAATLVDERLVLDRLVDARQVVRHGQDEARTELPELPARVHEDGEVRHEPPGGHELEKVLLALREELSGLLLAKAPLLGEGKLRLGDVRRCAPEHLDGLLYRLAQRVLLEVALLEDGQGTLGEVYAALVMVSGLHSSKPFPFFLLRSLTNYLKTLAVGYHLGD